MVSGETELKCKVTQEEFHRCLSLARALWGAETRKVQINYYFDSPRFFYDAQHATLRVRQTEKGLKLQFKHKRHQEGDVLICEECEIPLCTLPQALTPMDFFPQTPAEEAFLLGNLVTERKNFQAPDVVVSFDTNFYLGETDYEIEIEGDLSAIAACAARFSPQGTRYDGKFSRFLRVYRRLMKELPD